MPNSKVTKCINFTECVFIAYQSLSERNEKEKGNSLKEVQAGLPCHVIVRVMFLYCSFDFALVSAVISHLE